MQFSLGISSDLLTNEGKPCFGEQPYKQHREKQIIVEWMDSRLKFYQKKKLQNMMQFY